MFARRISLTNLASLCAIVPIVACTTREPTVKTNPEPTVSTASSVIAPAPSASSVSAAPIVSAEPPSDEPLIRDYEELARGPVTQSNYEMFVTTHPKLLTATARPYGTAIMWTLEHEHEQAALVLYERGAKTEPGMLALAARGGLDAFVSAMLANGADPNETDSWGYTALHIAAKFGHVSTIRKLFAAKALPSIRATNDGFTPLHIAVMERSEEVIPVLLAAHADIEARDDQGRTPLHWGPYAYSPQPLHIYRKLGEPHDTVFTDPGPAVGIKLLLDAGAKIDAVDAEGNTPLHEAALIGSVRGAEMLVARGAKTNIKNKAGETPIDIAKASEHRRGVLEILQRKH